MTCPKCGASLVVRCDGWVDHVFAIGKGMVEFVNYCRYDEITRK